MARAQASAGHARQQYSTGFNVANTTCYPHRSAPTCYCCTHCTLPTPRTAPSSSLGLRLLAIAVSLDSSRHLVLGTAPAPAPTAQTALLALHRRTRLGHYAPYQHRNKRKDMDSNFHRYGVISSDGSGGYVFSPDSFDLYLNNVTTQESSFKLVVKSSLINKVSEAVSKNRAVSVKGRKARSSQGDIFEVHVESVWKNRPPQKPRSSSGGTRVFLPP